MTITDDVDLGDETAKIFLSYSRKDRERAQRIADVLRDRHFGVFKDTDDILPTEEWRGRLEQLITEADTIVFLLSPHSVVSEVCAWEVEEAGALNKRIAPIVIEEVDTSQIPPTLARLNFIFCTERDRFEDAVDSLVSALNTDIDWIREHTRLIGLAHRWDKAGRSGHLLLSGQDVSDAETWRDTRPPESPSPTSLQLAFITESRRNAIARQRMYIVGSIVVAIVMAGLSVFAWMQSNEARAQRDLANEQREIAETQRALAEERRAEAEQQRKLAEEQRGIAEMQRDLADRRRVEVLQSSAGQRLRAEERADAVAALDEIRVAEHGQPPAEVAPLPVTMRVLLAGLQNGEGLLDPVPAGTPLLLNGRMHLKQSAEGITFEVKGFPARWSFSLNGRVVLITETGAMRLYDVATGAMIDEAAPDRTVKPFLMHQGSSDTAVLFSWFTSGTSACSINSFAREISEAGFGEELIGNICAGGAAITTETETIGIEKVLECIFIDDTLDIPDAAAVKKCLPGIDSVTALRGIAEFGFPQNLAEAGLWTARQSTDGLSITQMVVEEIAARTGIPDEQREGLAFYPQFHLEEDNAPDAWKMPDFATSPHIAVVENLYIWGMGGQENYLCVARDRQSDAECTAISLIGLAQFNGIRLSPTAASLVIFGQDLSLDPEANDYAVQNVYLFTGASDAEYRALAELNRYGEVLDIDYAPDGSRLAVLTPSAMIIFDPSSSDAPVSAVINPPKQAMAVEWTADGSLVVFSTDGNLYFASSAEGTFSRVDAADILVPRQDDGPISATEFWIAEDTGTGVIAVGNKNRTRLYDVGLRAPLTSAFDIDDPQLGDNSQVEPQISVGEDGAVEFVYNLRRFARSAPPQGGTVSDFIDPNTPLAPPEE